MSKPRGFAAMPMEQRRAIASKGGQAARDNGTAHRFDSASARDAGRKGGLIVSKDRAHMAAIGRKGSGKRRGPRH
jgi:Stress-induced bacterial acidophilic repeat motif.